MFCGTATAIATSTAGIAENPLAPPRPRWGGSLQRSANPLPGVNVRPCIVTVDSRLLPIPKNTSPLVLFDRVGSNSASDSAYCYTFLPSVVCLSFVVCHLISCTLLTSFDGFRCHLAGTLVGSNDTVSDGVPEPQGKRRFKGRIPQPKHAIANCCCHLANRNEKLRGPARAISPVLKSC